MATILSKEQCDRIKEIRAEITTMPGIAGWNSEGADDRCNAFFNNSTDEFFLSDYNGNIVYSKNTEITPELKKLAELEGKIRLICEDEPEEEREI